MNPIMNVLAGSAEAARNISNRIRALGDQQDAILVLEAHNIRLQTQYDNSDRQLSAANHHLWLASDWMCQAQATMENQQATIRDQGTHIQLLRADNARLTELLQMRANQRIPFTVELRDPETAQMPTGAAHDGLLEVLQNGFQDRTFLSGSLGRGSIRILLEYLVTNEDLASPEQLLASFVELTRYFQRRVRAENASFQFGPLLFQNVQPDSGEEASLVPIDGTMAIEVQLMTRKGNDMRIAGANLAGRSSSPANIFLRKNGELHSSIPVNAARVYPVIPGIQGNQEGEVSELEFQLPSLEIQSDVWTLEVSRFGYLGSIELGKLQPTPIFIAVKAVAQDLLRVTGQRLVEGGAAANFYIQQGQSEPQLMKVVLQKEADAQGIQRLIVSTKGLVDYGGSPTDGIDIIASHGGLGGSPMWRVPLAALQRFRPAEIQSPGTHCQQAAGEGQSIPKTALPRRTGEWQRDIKTSVAEDHCSQTAAIPRSAALESFVNAGEQSGSVNRSSSMVIDQESTASSTFNLAHLSSALNFAHVLAGNSEEFPLWRRNEAKKEIKDILMRGVKANMIPLVEALITALPGTSDPDSPLFQRNEDGESLVALASAESHTAMVELLLKWRVDPNWDEGLYLHGENGNNALHLAMRSPGVTSKGSDVPRLVNVLLDGGCNPWIVNAKGWSPYALASCSKDMLIPLRMMESRSLLKGTLKLGIVAKKLFKKGSATKEMHCVLAPFMTPVVQAAPLTLYFFQSPNEVSWALMVTLDGVEIESAVGGSSWDMTLRLADAQCIQGEYSDCLPSPAKIELGAEGLGEEGQILLQRMSNILRSCSGNIPASLARHLLLRDRVLDPAEIEEQIVHRIHETSQRPAVSQALNSGPPLSSPGLLLNSAAMNQAAPPLIDLLSEPSFSASTGAHTYYRPSTPSGSMWLAAVEGSAEQGPARSAPPYFPDDPLHPLLTESRASDADFYSAPSRIQEEEGEWREGEVQRSKRLASREKWQRQWEFWRKEEWEVREGEMLQRGPKEDEVVQTDEERSWLAEEAQWSRGKEGKQADFVAKTEGRETLCAERPRSERGVQEENETELAAMMDEMGALQLVNSNATAEGVQQTEVGLQKQKDAQAQIGASRKQELGMSDLIRLNSGTLLKTDKLAIPDSPATAGRIARAELHIILPPLDDLPNEEERQRRKEVLQQEWQERQRRRAEEDAREAAEEAAEASRVAREEEEDARQEQALLEEQERPLAEESAKLVQQRLRAEAIAQEQQREEERRQRDAELQTLRADQERREEVQRQILNAKREEATMMSCPISHDIMVDPVLLMGDGHSYERRCIEEWLARYNTSPVTGMELSARGRVLHTNYALRSAIATWRARNGEW